MDNLDDIMEFLREQEFEVNDFNVYIYTSKNGKHSVNLTALLDDYRDHLIEKMKSKK